MYVFFLNFLELDGDLVDEKEIVKRLCFFWTLAVFFWCCQLVSILFLLIYVKKIEN